MRRFLPAIFLVAMLGCAERGAPVDPTDPPPTPHAPIETAIPTPRPSVSPPRDMPAPPSTAQRARVVHVSDGDTIVLHGIDVGEIHASTGGRKARFIGVDTPEVFGADECYGAQASTFTEDALQGTTVLVDYDVDRLDRYGRALVYVWEADGSFFNGRLAAEGFALQMTVPPNVRYAALFTTLVARARDANEGLWSGCSN